MKWLVLFLFLSCYLTLSGSEGHTYYISPDGKDTNPGTIEKPWASIDAVSAHMWRYKAGDRIAFQRGGTYRFRRNPLLVSAKGITITSYGTGEKPVLNCFQILTDPTHEGSGLFSYRVSRQVFQLFQDGEYLLPSRWPDDREITRLGPVSNSTISSFTDEIGLDSIDPGARLHYKSYDWDLIHATITRYSNNPRGEDTLRWMPVASSGQSRNHGYYISGITSMINDPGEWSYNSNTRRVYVNLLEGNIHATMEATFQDRAIVVEASAITIENIEIRGASESAIEIASSGENFLIRNVDFTNNDCYCILAASGNPNGVTIRNCNFIRSWGRPIRFYGASNIQVIDNLFHIVGTDKIGGDIYGNGGAAQGRGSAIQVELVDGFRVENNRFEKLGANAVFLCGSTFKGRVVRNNVIREFHLLNSDGGAIYMDGDKDGDIQNYDTIQGNTIVDGYSCFKGFSRLRQIRLGYPRVYGIYHDEAGGAGSSPSQKCLIVDNTIDSTQTGILLHRVSLDVIRGNTIRHVRSCINNSDDPGDSISITHNYFENVADVPFEWTDWNDLKVPLPYRCDYNVLVVDSSRKASTSLYFRWANVTGAHNYSLESWKAHNRGRLDMNSVVRQK